MMSELVKKRWAGIDAKGRSDYARKMLIKRWKKTNENNKSKLQSS